MKWNWNPSAVAFLDFETRSMVDLTQRGSTAYLSDPSTELLALCVSVDGTVHVWAPHAPAGVRIDALRPKGFDGPIVFHGEAMPEVFRNVAAERTLVAHNAEGFDAIAWRRFCPGDPEWYDTVPCCKAGGLPGGLDALGQTLLGRGKDDAGKRALQMLWRGKIKNGEVSYPVGTPALWEQMLRYNVQDVWDLERVYDASAAYGEPDVLTAHTAINERGIAIDVPYLHKLEELWGELGRGSAARVEQLTGGKLTGDTLRSGPTVHRWLESQGLNINTLNRKELERLYDAPEDYFTDADADCVPLVIEVLKLRQIATRGTLSKVNRIRQLVESDGRVRRLLRYHGAHTGRWTGAGLQPQNLARGLAGLDVEWLLSGELTLDRVREAAKGEPLDDALSTLLRPVFVASPGKRFLIVDYASIEARGIAWIAGQEDLLDKFRSGADIYCDMAGAVFGRKITKADKDERQIGKVIVLGCGYGMSARKFASYCTSQGIDLAKVGTSADACVKAYRDKNPSIVNVWRSIGAAVMEAVKTGRTTQAGRCTFSMDGGHLITELPSCRRIVYRCASIEPRVPGYCKLMGLPEEPRPTVCYTHPKGYEGQLYGGLIAENMVQAICRDFLAGSLVNLERAGLPVVLHVHDEIVCEVPADGVGGSLETMARIMRTPPPWAEGFPLAVEGFDAPRYVKAPWSDSHRV